MPVKGEKGDRGERGDKGDPGPAGRDGRDGKGLTTDQERMLAELPKLKRELRPLGYPLWSVLLAIFVIASFVGLSVGFAITQIR